MPGPAPSTGYQGFDASPTGIPETESPAGRGPRFNVRADPNEFGAQIGGALQNAGKEGQQVGDEASQVALQYQGMLNESYATNAETQFITKAGDLDAKFKSKQGLDLVQAAPDHIAALTSLQQQIRQGLPGGAARAYDQLTERQLAYRINEANLSVAQGIKAADLESARGQIATSVASAGDMSVATNDERFNHVLQDIHFGQGRMMQNQGWGDSAGMTQNPDGSHSFTNKDGQSAYDQMTNVNVSKAWEDRLKAISENGNVMQAYDKYKENYDRIPPQGKVAMDQYFAPKIKDFQSRSIAENVLGQQTKTYNDMVYGKTTSAFNIGNVKTAEGAAQGTPAFVQPKTPEDGVILAANNLRSNYQGLTLQQIADKWAPPSENKTSDWVHNVSAATGMSPNAVPDLNDAGTLKNLVRGIGVAEKSSQDLSAFTPDVLDSGINKAISGAKPNINDIASNGKMVPSIADLYKANYSQILSDARDQAEKLRPGDVEFAEKAEANAKQRADSIITQDKLSTEASRDNILRAVDGELTKGVKPRTPDELIAISPEIKQAWSKLQIDNPDAATKIEKNMIGAKEDGKMGGGFSYLQQEAYQGKLDVNDLLYHVGDDLTQQGFNSLKGVIKASPSPDELSDNDRMAKFLKNGHEQILHSSLFHNTSEAEDAYQAWFSATAKQIKDKQAQGASLATLLDKNSKDYVGSNIHQFTIPVQKQLQDRAGRINERLQNSQPITDDKKRQPNETPDAYLQRISAP